MMGVVVKWFVVLFLMNGTTVEFSSPSMRECVAAETVWQLRIKTADHPIPMYTQDMLLTTLVRAECVGKPKP